jgi:hypothetical protein
MVSAMVAKHVKHVALIVGLVTHFHQPVATVNAMAMRIAQHVLKIVALI